MSKHKNSIRAELLAKRRALPNEQRATKSAEIVNHLRACKVMQKASVVATYCALQTEVCLNGLLEQPDLAEHVFVAPRTYDPASIMTFHAITATSKLEIGNGKVAQPLAIAPVTAAQDIDLFLIPLTACDRVGNRLGFGQGYYDRALAGRRGYKIGVGFHFQLIEHLESEDHDIPLDGFVSEKGLIDF